MDAYPMVAQCWERQQGAAEPSVLIIAPEDLSWYYSDVERSRGLPAPPTTAEVPTNWRAPDVPLTPTLVSSENYYG